MDPVAEIKARLSIEDLVRQYTPLHKKGRNYVAPCPFHQDKNPSFLVSPDKGIAYCFPCQKGGDIFSVYQLIENVDFPQALKELAEKAGVKLEDAPRQTVHADEKERMRACLEAACANFRRQLAASEQTRAYLAGRGLAPQELEQWEIGYAPDQMSALYEDLLKSGFSRKEVVASGLGTQRDLQDERVFDRFRGRVMFPIRDAQARLIGFGGRTLRNDDAKYLNTSDTPLYHKAQVLYGLPQAREAIRETKRVIVVEGYFDVLACHRVGVRNVVATCGTALTPEHARILKRHVDVVVLCLDGDRAGRAAAERAFGVIAQEELQTELLTLPDKDPADAALAHPEELARMLQTGSRPYLDAVLEDIRASDPRSASGRAAALDRLVTLYASLPTTAARYAFLRAAGPAMGMAESQLEADIGRHRSAASAPARSAASVSAQMFSAAEITLGIFLLYPRCRSLLSELMSPEEGLAGALFTALRDTPVEATGERLEGLPLSPEERERALLLQMYCEEHGFGQWSESTAEREIRRNCQNANRELIRRKQQDLTRRLLEARRRGEKEEEQLLRGEYQRLLALSRPGK